MEAVPHVAPTFDYWIVPHVAPTFDYWIVPPPMPSVSENFEIEAHTLETVEQTIYFAPIALVAF
jgi:hypothetical protein